MMPCTADGRTAVAQVTFHCYRCKLPTNDKIRIAAELAAMQIVQLVDENTAPTLELREEQQVLRGINVGFLRKLTARVTEQVRSQLATREELG